MTLSTSRATFGRKLPKSLGLHVTELMDVWDSRHGMRLTEDGDTPITVSNSNYSPLLQPHTIASCGVKLGETFANSGYLRVKARYGVPV